MSASSWSKTSLTCLSALGLFVACSSAGTGVNTDPSSETGVDSTTEDLQTSSPATTQPVPTTGNESDTTSSTDPTGVSTTGVTMSSSTGDDSTTGDSDSDSDSSTGDSASSSTTGEPDTSSSSTGDSSSSTGDPQGCEDGEQNGDETDIDCGGETCQPCADGQVCQSNPDCITQNCIDQVCTAPVCDDGIMNGDETDIDCGGSCEQKCNDGEGCKADEHCINNVCDAGICAPPNCNDGAQNGEETDIDCGGSECDPCELGNACVLDADCASNQCVDNICADGTCNDGLLNNAEAGIDCGGPNCGPCQLIINEVDYDQPLADTAEFVEILNNEASPVSLAGIRLVLINGANDTVYLNLDLSGAGTLASGQYLIIAPANFVVPPDVLKVNFAGNSDQIQNGAPDGIALIDAPNAKLLDALSYEGPINAVNIAGLGVVSLVEGDPLPVDVADSNAINGSLSRIPNGTDTNNAATDWAFTTTPTPGLANIP